MKLSLVASLLALNVIGAAQAATCFVNFYWGSTSYVSQDHVFGEIRAGTNCNPRVGLVSLKTQDYCDPHDAKLCAKWEGQVKIVTDCGCQGSRTTHDKGSGGTLDLIPA